MRNLLQAPKRLFLWLWESIFSPQGVLLLILLWWWNGFVVPDIPSIPSELLIGVPCVIASLWVGYKLFRMWVNRPRKQVIEKVVEKVVYRMPEPKETEDTLLIRYRRTEERAKGLPLDEAEKEELEQRIRMRLLREFTAEEGLHDE